MAERKAKAPERCETMAGLRAEIDALDGDLTLLPAARSRYAERAIVRKPREGIPAAAPERVREVLGKVRAGAAAGGPRPNLAGRPGSGMIAVFIARAQEVLGKDGS